MLKLIRKMHPATYIRSMLVMIGIQYSGAVALAGMQWFVSAIILLSCATLSMTNVICQIRRS